MASFSLQPLKDRLASVERADFTPERLKERTVTSWQTHFSTQESRERLALFAFLAILWGQFFLALIPTWSAGTYYSYGWLVPPAAVYFLISRRRDLKNDPKNRRNSTLQPWHLAILGVGCFLAFVLRMMETTDLHWKLPMWPHGFLVIGMTLFAANLVEGSRAWRHYLPVMIFCLVAIPPPGRVEIGLVANLTGTVVEVASHLCEFWGIPVEIAGHSYIINGELLNVSDGCSGIRSFQSSIMAALFAGELLRLALPARLSLLVLGVLVAFVGNSLRVLSLVDAFDKGGHEALDARHDPAGMLALAVTYGCIFGLAFLFDRLWRRQAAEAITTYRTGQPA